MVWTLDMDDYMGTFCNEGKYPLINILKKGLNLGQACKIISSFCFQENFKTESVNMCFLLLLFFSLFQLVPLLLLLFLQLRDGPPLEALGEALEEAPVVAAPLVEALAPVAWTAGSALERLTACTQTPKTGTSSTTAVVGMPTLSTV